MDLFHVLYCSVSMCVGVTAWFGWGGVVSLCRLKHCFSLHKDTTLVSLYSTIKMMHDPISIRFTDNIISPSQSLSILQFETTIQISLCHSKYFHPSTLMFTRYFSFSILDSQPKPIRNCLFPNCTCHYYFIILNFINRIIFFSRPFIPLFIHSFIHPSI